MREVSELRSSKNTSENHTFGGSKAVGIGGYPNMVTMRAYNRFNLSQLLMVLMDTKVTID